MFGFDFYIVVGTILLGLLAAFEPGRPLPPARSPRLQPLRKPNRPEPGTSIAWLREKHQLELAEPPRPTKPRIYAYWKLTGRLWDGPPPTD